MIRGRVVCIIIFIISIWSDLLVFVDDLCQMLKECFQQAKCGCLQQSAVLLAFWREMQPTDGGIRPTCSNLHTERFEVIF